MIGNQKVGNLYGGIDLNNADLGMQSTGSAIKFNVTPEALEKMKKALGFAPQILTILPLINLKDFLQ